MSVRILHVVGDSKFGGAARGILRLAGFWRSLDWDVELLATDPAFGEAAARAAIPVVPLDAIWREIRPWRDLAGLVRLSRLLRDRSYTVVHTHTTKAGFVGRLAARAAGVPIVVHTAHGFAFHEASRPAKIGFYTALERLASSCCDRVVAVSEFHRRWAISLGIAPAAKLVAIPNGVPSPPPVPVESVEATRRSLGIGPETVAVLSPGRLAGEKGLEDLIRAVRLLEAGRDRAVALFLAGEGGLRATLERLVHSLGVADRVRFLGFRHDVPALLAAADIVALPSLREGLSISLLEAMSMARPIVATSIGSNREATREGEGALLIPPGKLEAIATGLGRLADDAELAGRLARRAKQIHLDSYTLDRMLGGYHRLYGELLAEHGVMGKARGCTARARLTRTVAQERAAATEDECDG